MTATARDFCKASFRRRAGILLAVFLLGAGGYGSAAAQTVQPSAEQMRMINQLPPEQRRQALDALRQMQSGQQQSNREAARDDEQAAQQPTTRGRDQSADAAGADVFRAQAGSSLVITLTPRLELTEEELAAIENDPALRRVRGSRYYELSETGVLLLPGLGDIPLLGLSEEAIVERLGAEPALAHFDVQASILDTEAVGVAALEPFGYSVFGPEETDYDGGAGFEPAMSGPVPADYVLGPGDQVRVQLFGNVNSNYELEVSRSGTLNLPDLGPMQVAGLRYSEFRADLAKRVREMLIGTQVSVSMGDLRTIRVFAVGDVNMPGSYVVSSLATISSALYRSGGVSEVGTLRDIQLKRQGELIARLDIYDLLLRGDTSNDIQLQQGDVIFVPPIGTTIGVGGAVKRPAVYETTGNVTMGQALSLAGGLSADAFPEASTLERISSDKERQVLSVDLGTDKGRALPIRNGDTLTVPRVLRELTRSVRLEGHVHRPGPREWRDGMRLADLVPSLARLKQGADVNYVLIRRERMPGRRVQAVSADLSAALADSTSEHNLRLQSRDSVYVFDLAFGRQRVIEPILDEIRLQANVDSPFHQVRIAGTVRAPGAYPLEEGMRVSDLVRAGGNLAEGAYTDEAELTRFSVVNGEYREKEVIVVNLSAALRGNPQDNVLLSSYDHLRISRVPDWDSDWSVSLEGEVRFPGEYQVLRGETLRSVLNRAGGLTEQAFAEGAIFLRDDLKEREREQLEILTRRVESDLATLSLESLDSSGAEALSVGQSLLEQMRETEPVGRLVIDLDQILAGSGDRQAGVDVELKDGDRLLVPGRSQEVTVLGEAQYPSSHLYKSGLSRDDYISFSGGLTRKADKRLIYVVRASGAVVSANRSRWFSRSGIEIRPGDTIVIPVETDRIRPLTFWTNVSQIFYQTSIAIAAIASFNR